MKILGYTVFTKCKHSWIDIDEHCLGLNPPEYIVTLKCSLCGKIKTRKILGGYRR